MVNEWTSDDVPSVSSLDLYNKRPGLTISGKRFGAAVALEAVVEHLNSVHPKPEFEGYCTCNGPDSGGLMGDCGVALHRAQYRAGRAKAEIDRWRRSHSIVEWERDQARESLRRLSAETDFDLFTVHDQLKQCRGEREQMTRDRDEWRERAEAAEARTTPAVTRDEVWRVVAAHDPGDDEMALCRANRLTDVVWALVSGDDPAVFVVRESQIAAVEVERKKLENSSADGWFVDGRAYGIAGEAAEEWRDAAKLRLDEMAGLEAVARTIEAVAVDPIEEKARELWGVVKPSVDATWSGTSDLAKEQFRRVAAHVLGQEAGE